MKLFDVLNDISFDKKDLMDGDSRDEVLEIYNQYFINKGLSQHPDTILYANDMNLYFEIPDSAHYLYLSKSIRVRKRYGKWAKSLNDEELLECISKYYNVGKLEAIMYAKILSPQQKRVITDKYSELADL